MNVTYGDWEREVRFGLGIARRLGAKVSMAGFSTGGALSLDAVAENFEPYGDQISFGNLFLFSPAIGFDNPRVGICDVPGVDYLYETLKPWTGDPNAVETNPYKYAKMSSRAACELVELTEQNSFVKETIKHDIAAHGIGVFAVESMADTTVSPKAVVSFMDSLPAEVHQKLVLYPKADGIQHANVTRPEMNPKYGEMISALDDFLARSAGQVAVKVSIFAGHQPVLNLPGSKPF
jgi:hypothetical protein